MKEQNQSRFFRIYARNGQEKYCLMPCIFALRPALAGAIAMAKEHLPIVSAVAIVGINAPLAELKPEVSQEELDQMNVVVKKEFSALQT